MEPVNYQKVLNDELEALIGAGADVPMFDSEPTVASEKPKEIIVDCCMRPIDQCQCASTSSKIDENYIPGSTHSLEEFAIAKHVMQLVSTPNILTSMFTDITYENVTTEFKRFIIFLRKQEEPARSQLETLVLPIIVHCYALLIQHEECGVGGARNFLNFSEEILLPSEEYKEAIKALSIFTDIEKMKLAARFKQFVNRKTIIKISKDVFKSLQEYIKNTRINTGHTVLLSVLSFYIDFVDCDLCSCPDENNENKDEKSSGEDEKSLNDFEEIIELKPPDQILKNIEISRVVILPKTEEPNIIVYDLHTEERVAMKSIAEYIETKKRSKAEAARRSLPHRNPPRNVSNRFMTKPKVEDVKVDPKPKKEKEVKPNSSFKSVHSIDFNSCLSEIAFATGDEFIYTLAVSIPLVENRKLISLIRESTVALHTLEHSESDLKSTREPDNNNVYVVKYLPEEPFCLLVACSVKVRMFNTQTCSFIAEYYTDRSFIYEIDVDSSGQYFATANHNLVSYICTLSQNTAIRVLIGHEKAVTAVKFHPNGIYVATGSDDCTVRMFEVENAQCVRVFVGHVFGVWMIDFSCDGKLIASADSSGLVNVWDIKDCYVVSKMGMRVSEEVYSVVHSLCFHEESLVLAACNEKGEVRFWDALNPENQRTVRFHKKPLKIGRHKDRGGWVIGYASMSNIENESFKPKLAPKKR